MEIPLQKKVVLEYSSGSHFGHLDEPEIIGKFECQQANASLPFWRRGVFTLMIASKEETEKKYKEYREALLRECHWLNSSIYLYRRIMNHSLDMPRAYKLAPHFFGIILHSLFSNIIVSSFKLFDEKGERGFHDYLRFVENNMQLFTTEALKKRMDHLNDGWLSRQPPISKEVIEADRKSVLELNAFNSIKTRRDKMHAHLDKDYFTDQNKLHDDNPIKWEDLTSIQELMNRIFNRYSIAFDGSEYSIGFWNTDDVDRLFRELQDKNEQFY